MDGASLIKKDFWYANVDDYPLVVAAGAFQGLIVTDRGGIEIEIPTTLAGIVLTDVFGESAGTVACWVRHGASQFLTLNSSLIAAGNIQTFGSPNKTRLTVPRTGTTTAAADGLFLQSTGVPWPIGKGVPLFVPGGRWLTVVTDALNTSSSFRVIYVEIPKSNA